MKKWLWWFLEPFTKPRYKLTMLDGIKALFVVIICLVIIVLLGYLILVLWEWLDTHISKMKSKRLRKKEKKNIK